MHHAPDLRECRFGRLVVVRQADSDRHGNAKWLCRCDCGNENFSVRAAALKGGATKSCGCLRTAYRHSAHPWYRYPSVRDIVVGGK